MAVIDSPLLQIFSVGFGLNLAWELTHCQLYETCRRQTWRQNTPLLIKMSFKDAVFIVLFYFISAGIIWLFVLLSLAFAFVDEKISVKRKRWEYAASMPTLFGVGLTPMLEIAVTGLITFVIVF